jgi:hypothetical protein
LFSSFPGKFRDLRLSQGLRWSERYFVTMLNQSFVSGLSTGWWLSLASLMTFRGVGSALQAALGDRLAIDRCSHQQDYLAAEEVHGA